MSRNVDILVLGGSGPIGRAVERVSGRMKVRSISRSGPEPIDIDDSTSLDHLFSTASPRAVVYLVNDRSASLDRATARLRSALAASQRNGVTRFVFASSAAVYGDRHRTALHEETPLTRASDYAATKIDGEQLVASAHTIAGVSTVSLRVFNVFGTGCDDSLINRLAFGPPPTLRLSSSFVRDYVDVDDVARAFIAAIERVEVAGEVNVGRGVPVDNRQLAETVAADRYHIGANGADSFSIADTRRADTSLSWRARVDPLDKLRRGSPL